MKKNILPLLLIIIIGLTSCQKLNVADELPQSGKLPTTMAKKEIIELSSTLPYQTTIFNTCLNENVFITGQATYTVKESFDNGVYLNYVINLDNVTAISQSGIEFKLTGGKEFMGTVRASEDGMDTHSRTKLSIKYISKGGNKMEVSETTKFIQVNGNTKIEFIESSSTCE